MAHLAQLLVLENYATELKNISKDASQSLLMEVTSHHLALLRSPKVFNYAVGLVGGRPASKKARALLNTMLECITPETEVHTSSEARFNALAHCQKGDVVLIRHDCSFIAGKVLMHASVEGVLLSLITEWSLHSTNMEAGYAKWDTRGFRSLVDTCSILDAVCYTKHCTIATTLLPAEFRARAIV